MVHEITWNELVEVNNMNNILPPFRINTGLRDPIITQVWDLVSDQVWRAVRSECDEKFKGNDMRGTV